MTTVERRLTVVHAAISRLFPFVRFEDDIMKPAQYEFYKYSPYFSRLKDDTYVPDNFKGLKVGSESTWESVMQFTMLENDESDHAYSRFLGSIHNLDELVPDEEFLRFYKIDEDHHFHAYVQHRSDKEGAVYGDIAMLHWVSLIIEISRSLNFYPLGLRVLKKFVMDHGPPFKQNSRDVAKIEECNQTYMIALFVEMCLAESLSEINIYIRSQEEGIDEFKFAGKTFKIYDIVREFFTVILPHPKKVNNMLRAAYTWFVKSWGTGCDELIMLKSRASDDRNSKDVIYEGYVKEKNTYAGMMKHSSFYKRSLDANYKKTCEAMEYADDQTTIDADMPIFIHMLRNVYRTSFDPRNIHDVMLASYLLSIQTIAGYGRAWVMNKPDDPEKILPESKDNYVRALREKTRDNLIKLYKEAREHGFEIVKPSEMYTSLLRMAKNTSSGMAVEVEVRKVYGPTAEKRISYETVKSRQKALVVFLEGDKIYSRENMTRRFDTNLSFQTKGSRDVPIKSTRTVYSIHIGVLAPQLIMTLPLNEYVSKVGGKTTKDSKSLGSKIIVGDLEATGSRVVDAADTFRNSGDISVMTLAVDYADYDQHMSLMNFRSGMIDALEYVAEQYNGYDYEGWTTHDMVQAGWGEGRIIKSKWLGNRKVYRMSKQAYDALDDVDKEPIKGDPLSKVVPGTRLVSHVDKIVEPKDGEETVLVVTRDGSDLATITTHLSGENSTLVANSAHNAGIGAIMVDHIEKNAPGVFEVLSEQYVGDDTLMYLRLHTRDAKVFDKVVSAIMEAIQKCGHEASESKTTFLVGSCEKTQTHAKQGIYIPQDRMMMVSSERRKDIEDVQGYMRSQIATYTTKVSRGFSEELAQIILLFKSSLLGYRKFKRTIKDGFYRNRRFYSDEDGMTLVRLNDPMIFYTPVDWNGYGGNPIALNIVTTPELVLDMLMMKDCEVVANHILKYAGRFPPCWNETNADTRQLGTESPMGLYTKLTRPIVRAALSAPELKNMIAELPLQGFGPYSLSRTMMRQAVLKESRARVLLVAGYEEDYQKSLNEWKLGSPIFIATGRKREITAGYAKLFDVMINETKEYDRFYFPDVNLCSSFLRQKVILGNRRMRRMRMSYVDRIDAILRGDVVMRGFITANHVMAILEDLGTNHTLEDMSTIFQLINITPMVADRLARYVCSERASFDTLMLAKQGMLGDEFSMSLDLLTEETFDRIVERPSILMKTEVDALALHASQIMMLRAAMGYKVTKILFRSPELHKHRVRAARIRARMMNRKTLSALCGTLRKLSTAIIQHQ